MRRNLYLGITGTIFGIIACMHLARLTMSCEVSLGGFVLPLWISWLGLLVAAALSIWAFSLMRK